jgi:cell division transport system permease protein
MVIDTFRRAFRGIREHFYLTTVSVGVITAALVLGGVYALAVVNLQAVVSGWQHDVHVSAYFAPGVDEAARAAALSEMAGRPEVEKVELVSSEDARAWMEARVPEVGPVVAELGADALPASLEVTLRQAHQSPAAMDAFAASLTASGSFAEVDYGREWVERADSFLAVLRLLGVALGGILAVATLFLVGNTINLVVFARRDELEIMRLVGATDSWILAPFLVEGALQGLVATLLAFGSLELVHTGLLSRLHDVLPLAFAAGTLEFLPAGMAVGMAAAGVTVGVLPAWVAVRRFLAGMA